jgi:Flp pilus assembly protein TadG
MKHIKCGEEERKSRGFNRRFRGQAILETAFVILAMLLLSMGLLQFGLIYYTSLTLGNLTRDGARYAAINALDHTAEGELREKVKTYLKQKAVGTTIDPEAVSNATLTVKADAVATGKPVQVELTYNMKSRFFLPVDVFPGLSSTSWSSYKTSSLAVIE